MGMLKKLKMISLIIAVPLTPVIAYDKYYRYKLKK